MTSRARSRTRFTAGASVAVLALTGLVLTGPSGSAAEPPSSWGPSVAISGAGVLSSPDVAAGPSAAIDAAWGGPGADVRYRHRPPGSAWLAEQPLGAGGSPSLGVDAKGTVTAVWFRRRAGMITEIVTRSRPASGSWGALRVLSRVGQDEQDGTGVRDVDLAVSSGGAVVAAWTWGSDEGGPVQRVQAAYKPAGGAWRGPTDLATPSQCAGEAATAIGSGGNAVVVCRGSDGVIRAVRHLSAGWTQAVPLSAANNFHPDVAIGPDGGTVAVWQHHTPASDEPPTLEDHTIKATRLVSGRWTTPQQLSPSGGTSLEPMAVVDGSQAMTVVWRVQLIEDDVLVGERLDAARRAPGAGTSFGAPATVAPSDDRISAVEVAASSAGDVVVGWFRLGAEHSRLEAATRPRRHGWTAPVELSGPAGVAGDEATPAVAVDACGRGIVAWHDSQVRVRRMAACAS
jgi:hypothetical protein